MLQNAPGYTRPLGQVQTAPLTAPLYRDILWTMDTTIKKEIERVGGARKVATDLGLSTQAVYLYMHGKRPPSPLLLEYLKVERIVIYRRKK